MSDCSEITKFWFNSEEDNFREKWFQRDPNKLRALDIFIKDKFGIYLTYFDYSMSIHILKSIITNCVGCQKSPKQSSR